MKIPDYLRGAGYFLATGIAEAIGYAVDLVNVVSSGLQRVWDVMSAAWMGVISIGRNLAADLLENLVAIPLDLQSGLQFAFEKGLEFFGNGMWDLIANIGAGLQFAIHKAVAGLVSALPDTLKGWLGVEDIAPKSFKEFQDAAKQNFEGRKTGFKAGSYADIRQEKRNRL